MASTTDNNTFDQNIGVIRNGSLGRDVRSAIGNGLVQAYDSANSIPSVRYDAVQNLTSAQKMIIRENSGSAAMDDLPSWQRLATRQVNTTDEFEGESHRTIANSAMNADGEHKTFVSRNVGEAQYRVQFSLGYRDNTTGDYTSLSASKWYTVDPGKAVYECLLLPYGSMATIQQGSFTPACCEYLEFSSPIKRTFETYNGGSPIAVFANDNLNRIEALESLAASGGWYNEHAGSYAYDADDPYYTINRYDTEIVAGSTYILESKNTGSAAYDVTFRMYYKNNSSSNTQTTIFQEQVRNVQPGATAQAKNKLSADIVSAWETDCLDDPKRIFVEIRHDLLGADIAWSCRMAKNDRTMQYIHDSIDALKAAIPTSATGVSF